MTFFAEFSLQARHFLLSLNQKHHHAVTVSVIQSNEKCDQTDQNEWKACKHSA